jgi:FAD/FMN-containing dehydrogenase/NAD-dependent dihydropyrimidine dehydrogenase PreA subunit
MRRMDGKLKRRLEDILGDEARILEGAFERELFSTDMGEVPFANRLFDTTPELVIQPKSINALKKIVRVANEERVALFPRGMGSSGLGGVVPTSGGIVLDFSTLNSISALDRENGTIKAQTGVRWSDLEDFLKNEDLSVRAYPSSFFSTVGGWIATGGYGIGSFQFGHLKDQIESIEVMFPSGEIKSFTADEEEFTRFFGTEGQFGILLAATLKLRKKPEKTLPHLIYFGSAEAAVTFITQLIQEEITPYHIKYVDPEHLAETNKNLEEDLFAEKDAVLVAFEDDGEEQKFLTFSENQGILADDYLAHYLWQERLFPMKRRSGNPTPLACELILPLDNVVLYLNKANRKARRYGINIQAESHIVGRNEALVMVTYGSDVRDSKAYLAHLAFIPVLTRLGIKFDGAPYGVGIWNAPFINDKFNQKTLRLYKAYKKEVDPQNILNPNKFFAVTTKWANIPGILFKPRVYRPLIRTASLITPVLAKQVITTNEEQGESALEEITYACLKCGSCAANCPAFIVTHEESLIPKNKLLLAKKLLDGKTVSKSDADKIFLCMHCGMCREICQNDLDLVTAWSELEQKLEDKYGKPEEAIRNFVSKIESNEDYWRLVYA